MSPEEQKDLEERKDAFIKGYETLKNETQIDIYFMPQFIPDGKGNFLIKVFQNLVNLKDQGMPSDASLFL